MTTPFQGGAALGEILFGGRNRGNSDAYLSRLRDNATTAKAMDDAANAQIMRLARESMQGQKVQDAYGVDAPLADFIATMLRSQQTMNANTVGVTPLQMQEYQMRRRAEEALAPEMGLGNAALAAIYGKPLKFNTIDAGYQLNPYEVGGAATPTQGKLGDIALSGAKVATEGARQDELGARASVSRAKAKAGGFAPSRGGSGGGSGGPKRSPSEAKAIVTKLESEMGRPLTAEEVAQVYSGGDFNFQAGPDKKPAGGKPPKGGWPRPTPAAIKHLWKNPQLKAAFAEKYGPVAAEMAMLRKPK